MVSIKWRYFSLMKRNRGFCSKKASFFTKSSNFCAKWCKLLQKSYCKVIYKVRMNQVHPLRSILFSVRDEWFFAWFKCFWLLLCRVVFFPLIRSIYQKRTTSESNTLQCKMQPRWPYKPSRWGDIVVFVWWHFDVKYIAGFGVCECLVHSVGNGHKPVYYYIKKGWKHFHTAALCRY